MTHAPHEEYAADRDRVLAAARACDPYWPTVASNAVADSLSWERERVRRVMRLLAQEGVFLLKPARRLGYMWTEERFVVIERLSDEERRALGIDRASRGSRYDPRYCSTKRLVHLEQRPVPSPPSAPPSWDDAARKEALGLPVPRRGRRPKPRRRQRPSSDLARGLNAQARGSS